MKFRCSVSIVALMLSTFLIAPALAGAQAGAAPAGSKAKSGADLKWWDGSATRSGNGYTTSAGNNRRGMYGGALGAWWTRGATKSGNGYTTATGVIGIATPVGDDTAWWMGSATRSGNGYTTSAGCVAYEPADGNHPTPPNMTVYVSKADKTYYSADVAKSRAYRDASGRKLTKMSKAPAGYVKGE